MWTILRLIHHRVMHSIRRGPRTLVLFLLCAAMSTGASARNSAREEVLKIVTQIQRADYQGNRDALKRLYGELSPFVDNKELASRVLYWRGFALWRRALNGFNDSVDLKVQQADLQGAADEFAAASTKDPGFADPKVGALSCFTLLAFSINQGNPQAQQEFITKGRQVLKDAQALAPDNPRFAWVLGGNLWYTPPERGGGQAKAIELYEKGLEVIRNHKTEGADPLDPSWGEPELMVNLAWSNLNRTTPDLKAAEQYARSALELVPYWHYLRDILIPQIQEAKKKAARQTSQSSARILSSDTAASSPLAGS
jgi:hypothetical protein